MQYELAQRGRAMMDFEVTTRLAAAALHRAAEGELADRGITADTLPKDMEQRHDVIDTALKDSPVFQARQLLGEWCAKQHGRAAEQAFAEIADTLVPELERLREGGTTITRHDDYAAPKYWSDIWFHRTRGGWDADVYNGFVHGELVHKRYVSKVFPGDIYGSRRVVLKDLPRDDYRRILEIGTSSGHHTVAIAEVFPDARLTGIDPSLRMLEQAQRVANEQGLAWDLHVGVGEALPFAEASFDLVTAYAIHHEMPPRIISAIFAEAFRVLEPGGDMAMADVTRTGDLDRLAAWRMDWAAKWGGEPFWRATAGLDMVPMAEAAGFVDVRGYAPNPGRDPYVIYGRKPA
ncbi:class I SAM-dependent methyltransferase [Sphingomonas bacterium]|uniref:class I SAM-dependent methyltransferase n=1 Tax=Sphingomonas bacterium TaxID=1895847 RepID=UPI001575E17C|nr:class I SAM-dependent methyltransferase [Sphingomonas bacterium]